VKRIVTSTIHCNASAGETITLVNDMGKQCHVHGDGNQTYPFAERPIIDSGASGDVTVLADLSSGDYKYKVTPKDIRSITVP